MAGTLTIAYLAVAVVTAIVVAIVSARLGDERLPVLRRLGLSVAAGLVWPVMLLGLAEIGSLAAYVKAHQPPADAEDQDIDVLV